MLRRGYLGGNARDRNVPVTGVEQIAVDFVRTDNHIVPQAYFGESFQFTPAKHPADRVVRVAQEKDPGLGGDGCLEGVEVYFVGDALLHKGGVGEKPSPANRVIEEMKIDRRLGEDRLTGL